ncbi:twin-arginine translocation pathway signal protein [Parvularcula sp. ZS-1/3]|uniref:Twin-arginine translocation pathway signal protein n=1 Tax=Parvularcula mediterranea TaxID=2732508 RepID=A0A7Y3W402_9PROT|nr:twin-arginine translocation pathway signal protein [Parvularcula mediterranea]NNU15275.1 twin-arginine translocation pathway signal protein [Parvularcula mediterranea]
MNRRHLLKTGTAAAIILSTSVPQGARAIDAPPKGPRAAWQRAGSSFGDPRLDALAFGILAPNPHNKQPWLVELSGESDILVRCQLDRRLPMTDPPDRQITIGLGAFVELTKMAANAQGYSAEVTPFPQGTPTDRLDDRPVARIRLSSGPAEADPLFAQVLERRTNRETYEERMLDPSAVEAIVAAGRTEGPHASDPGSVLQADDIEAIRQIATEAWAIEHGTDRTWKESVDVTRVGKREVAQNPDGIAVEGFPMGLLRAIGIMSEENLMKEGSMARRSSLDFYQKSIDTARGFLTLTAAENTREGQLTTGAQWLRMQMKATELGVAFHPLSQALQEFKEMEGPYRAIHEKLRPTGVVHMLARIGYADRPGPSPRWPLESRITDA